MSRDRSAQRPDLDVLLNRARNELRDWTDRTDSDPGVALLELFALVGDLLASHTERLEGEGYLGSSRRGGSVGHRHELEVIDVEVDGAPFRVTCGLYRATVLTNEDPLGRQRLLVQIPEISGNESLWATACLAVLGANEVPAIGAEIWIALESGDPSQPIWLGQRVIE